MTRPLRLCILENGLVPEALRDDYASYPAMIEQWLHPELPEATFTDVAPVKGEALPAPEDFDGYLLSGSRHSVYEDLEWIHRTRTFLQALRQQGRPVFGICFGHQLMAEAFGGKTQKAAQGWGVGAQAYYYRNTGLLDGAALVFHQDQVVRLPPEAQVIGSSAFCPNGALVYDFPALSVQYHPEFTPAYIEALSQRYGGNLIPEAVAAHSVASLQQLCVNNRPVARWVADFFRHHATQ